MAGAAGAAAGGALAAAAGCGAAVAGAPGTGGAAGAGGAGPGAANAAAAAGAAAAGDAKNGKSGPVGRAPTSSPTGTARRRRGPGWRGRCVDNARVRKCSPRPSAPPRLPLPGPHARWRRSISGPGSVSARLSGHAPRAACAPNSEGLSGPRSGRRCPWALPVVPALAKPSVCPRPGGRKEGRKERAAQVEKNGPIENLGTSSFFPAPLTHPPSPPLSEGEPQIPVDRGLLC